MPCAQGGTGSDRRAQARGSAVPGLRRGRVEGGPFRRIQAVHEKGRPVPARPPAAAGLRLEAARPHRPAQIGRWFDRFSRTAPGNANHALDLLTQIINFAIARGHLETNPARDVERNPRRMLTRFLSREEIARLHRVLDRQTRDSRREQADIIRLLLLTGCRRSEILRLRWSEVDRDRLVLADSKTGPQDRSPQYPGPAHSRTPAARRKPVRLSVPERSRPAPQPQPCVLGSRPAEAGIEDVRLHDLRHTHASHAVMNGVPVPVIARLLGHSDVRTTLRYAHLGDREIEQAAERVGQAIATLLRA